MTATPLESRLTRYAATLAADGRNAAAEIRTGPLSLVDDHLIRLESAERHLTGLLLAVSAGYDLPATDAPLMLSAGATGRTTQADIAKRWARTACRGHSWAAVTEPAAGDIDALADAVTVAGIAPERAVWAPGLTDAEARAVCDVLGIARPEPLANIDARIEEWGRMQAVAADGEDPDQW